MRCCKSFDHGFETSFRHNHSQADNNYYHEMLQNYVEVQRLLPLFQHFLNLETRAVVQLSNKFTKYQRCSKWLFGLVITIYYIFLDLVTDAFLIEKNHRLELNFNKCLRKCSASNHYSGFFPNCFTHFPNYCCHRWASHFECTCKHLLAISSRQINININIHTYTHSFQILN